MGSKQSSTKNGGDVQLEVLDEHAGAINCLTLSDDGSLLVTGGDDGTARMWCTKAESCECLGVLEGHKNYITCVAITEAFVVTGSADNTIRKWDMTTCECVFEYKGHKNRICRIICNGKFIFSSSYDKFAKAWIFDAEELEDDTKVCVRTFVGHAKGVYPMIYIPSSAFPPEVDEDQINIDPSDVLITGSADCTARSWSVDTGGCLRVFQGHTDPIMCMAADESGQHLFTGAGDHTVRCWDIKNSECLIIFSGHNSAIIGIQIVGKMMYTASSDQTAKAWVTDHGDCTRTFEGHNHSVTNVKYYGGMVFTGCGDGMVRAFDGKSGAARRTYKGHESSITGLAVVCQKLYTSSADGTLRVWDVSDMVEDVKSEYNAKEMEENTNSLCDLEEQLDSYIDQQGSVDLKKNTNQIQVKGLGEQLDKHMIAH